MRKIVCLTAAWILCCTSHVRAQPECTGWGGLRGIRVDGELMRFSTSLRAIRPGWSEIALTAEEQVVNAHYAHLLARQTMSGGLRFRDRRTLQFTETIDDTGDGTASIDLQCKCPADVSLDGVYFFINLPQADYADGSVQLAGADAIDLAATRPTEQNTYLRASTREVRFIAAHRRLVVAFDSPTDIVVRDDGRRGSSDTQLYFPIGLGDLKAGQTLHSEFTIKVTGDVNKEDIHLTLDPTRPGRAFDGIGGNFRLQNPAADPPAIAYNLDNLRLAWGRVAMPLNDWQPNEADDPTARPLAKPVREAMEMAAELNKRKIPVIASVWVAPAWSLGPAAAPPLPGVKALRGRPVLPEKAQALCKTISSYLLYMKSHYGVEPELFSFNESNLGIDVRQTGREHAEMIKLLGAEFAAEGLGTKQLLGDTSDAHAIEFIKPALSDAEAMKYVGAISFHSWRGGDDGVFTAWADAADRVHLPLLCAEGGTDPGAYKYPAIFEEPWFALDEINLYVRMCALCQPNSILHWQLTSDYAVVAGGHSGLPLRPLKRFWQLKQLSLTPAGALSIPIRADQADISCCAFAAGPGVVLHLVNTGPTRRVILSGLPASLNQFHCVVTDAGDNMNPLPPISISNGTARFSLNAMSFVTLVGGQ